MDTILDLKGHGSFLFVCLFIVDWGGGLFSFFFLFFPFFFFFFWSCFFFQEIPMALKINSKNKIEGK